MCFQLIFGQKWLDCAQKYLGENKKLCLTQQIVESAIYENVFTLDYKYVPAEYRSANQHTTYFEEQ